MDHTVAANRTTAGRVPAFFERRSASRLLSACWARECPRPVSIHPAQDENVFIKKSSSGLKNFALFSDHGRA
jgi:hypothetical protein